MNLAYLHALAALAGSAIGGMASVASAWLVQRRQDRAKRVSRDKASRQKLYKQFIDEASKLYADALMHEEAEVSALFSVYALISQMRVLSSSTVVGEAEAVVRVIVDTYFAPNKTFSELRKLMDSHPIDPLHVFSEKCREELSSRYSPIVLGSARRALEVMVIHARTKASGPSKPG